MVDIVSPSMGECATVFPLLSECLCGCGQMVDGYQYKNRKGYGVRIMRYFVNRHNFRLPHRIPSGEKCYNWKGGRKYHTDENGYIMVLVKNHHNADKHGYVMQHRLVYEEYHKCCLLDTAVIHHRNEIKSDNRQENLEAFARLGDHSSYHHTGLIVVDHSDTKCLECGSDRTLLEKKNGRPRWMRYQGGYKCWNCFQREYQMEWRHKHPGY